MITLYGISNCDTIRKTRRWLDDREQPYLFHDYKKLGCPADLIEKFLQHFTYQDLINTRGTTWRKLPEATRNSLDQKLAIELMTEQPSIIKRPIIESGCDWIIGFDAERLAQLE